MSLKKVLLLGVVTVFTLSSCEKIKDIAAVDVETEITSDIDLESAGEVALKSTAADYNVGGTAELSLEDNDDVKDYIEGFRSVTPGNPTYEITGLESGDSFSSLKLDAKVNGLDYNLLDAGTITFGQAAASLSNVNDLIDSWESAGWDSAVTFTVSGVSNFDVDTKDVKVKIKIPATVSYSPL